MQCAAGNKHLQPALAPCWELRHSRGRCSSNGLAAAQVAAALRRMGPAGPAELELRNYEKQVLPCAAPVMLAHCHLQHADGPAACLWWLGSHMRTTCSAGWVTPASALGAGGCRLGKRGEPSAHGCRLCA